MGDLLHFDGKTQYRIKAGKKSKTFELIRELERETHGPWYVVLTSENKIEFQNARTAGYLYALLDFCEKVAPLLAESGEIVFRIAGEFLTYHFDHKAGTFKTISMEMSSKRVTTGVRPIAKEVISEPTKNEINSFRS